MRALAVRKIPTFGFGLLALLAAPTEGRAGITQILDSAGDGTHPSLSPRPIVVDPDGNVYVASVLTDNARNGQIESDRQPESRETSTPNTRWP